MNPDEVETFLAVVEHGTLSRAAETLFISQGTASNRIRGLEQELGTQLFHRQKGHRVATLTAEGEALVPIAEQLSALWSDARLLRLRGITRELRIAASDFLNTYVLGPAYQRFTAAHPAISLNVQTEHSTETHQLVESQRADLGFVFSQHARFHNVIATPLFTEEMVYLADKDSAFAESRALSDLDPRDEIFSRWSEPFVAWHRQHFPRSGQPRITVGTVSMLPLFLADRTAWTVATRSVANMLQQQNNHLQIIGIDHPPPARTAFLLENRHPRPWVRQAKPVFMTEALRTFEDVGMQAYG